MRLIDADALIESLEDIDLYREDKVGKLGVLKSMLEVVTQPTIEERKKGKWILDDKSGRYRCSECLSVASRDDHGAEVLSDYCGVCGAEMEKE